jgi:hypothetical protein
MNLAEQNEELGFAGFQWYRAQSLLQGQMQEPTE